MLAAPGISVERESSCPALRNPREADGTLAWSSTSARWAISTIGCAAVPSTCSPTFTNRLTTVPSRGEWITALLRPGVLKIFTGSDAPLKKCFIASSRKLGVFQIGACLGHCRFGLLELIAERVILQPRNDLPGADVIPFGNLQFGNPARHERADADILVR